MASDREALIAERVVQQVAELPDRTSPDDWPDAMLVTSDELKAIVLAALAAPPSAQEGWQPIETAPRRQRVLIGGGGCPTVHENEQRSFGRGQVAWAGLGDKQQPTHWMPLPPPPAGAPKS